MNLEALLEPIEGADPCGDDLSFSREFDAVQESRRADDPTLAQGDWTRPLKSADWQGVAMQCEALLRRRSKDLRVAVWLADALARTEGFAGLADGLRLCAGLCETWWDRGLHPRADDGGDASARVGSLDWLLGRVVGAAATAPLLRDGETAFGLRDIEAAQALQRSAGRSAPEDAVDPDATTVDDIARAEAVTPPDFLAANMAAVQRAVEALGRLQSFVDARLGDDGPAFAAARKALDDALPKVVRLARGRVPGAAASPGLAVSPALPVPAEARVATDGLRTRDEALRQLRAVADFFRRTEPHSPVGYLAEKAAGWGDMPLHDWLRAVLRDPGVLAQMEELLGVPPSSG